MVHTFSDKNNRYSVDMMISYINIFKPDSIFINVNEYKDYLDNDCWGYFNKKKRIKITPKIVLENPKKYKKHKKLPKNCFEINLIHKKQYLA